MCACEREEAGECKVWRKMQEKVAGEEKLGGWTKRQRGEDQHAGIKERREGSK